MTLILIFITLLSAHEDLPSTTCTHQGQTIVIQQTKPGSYTIQTPDMQKARTFAAPQVTDAFDPKFKQVFDTYSFKDKGLNLVIKRPETKGPKKRPFALWKNKTFECQ